MSLLIPGQHRRATRVITASYALDYAPRHCAGGDCFHPHPGDPVLPTFPQLDDPVHRCERRGIHGAHDVTTDDGDFRCPGTASGYSRPLLKQRVDRVRAAIRRPA